MRYMPIMKSTLVVILVVILVTVLVAPSLVPWADPAVVLPAIEGTLLRWGLAFVFCAALAEGVVAVGFLVPGTAALIVAGVLVGRGEMQLAPVVVTAGIGLTAGYMISYALGRCGLAQLANQWKVAGAFHCTRERIAKASPWQMVLLLGDPRVAALTATAIGTSQAPVGKSLATITVAALIWVTTWVVGGATVGAIVIDLVATPALIVILIGILLVSHIWRSRRKQSRAEAPVQVSARYPECNNGVNQSPLLTGERDSLSGVSRPAERNPVGYGRSPNATDENR